MFDGRGFADGGGKLVDGHEFIYFLNHRKIEKSVGLLKKMFTFVMFICLLLFSVLAFSFFKVIIVLQ